MLNLLQLGFLFCAILTFLLGSLINWCSNYIPVLVHKLYKYGKFSQKGYVSWTIQVPKRWFRHFYVFSSILSLYSLYNMYNIYFNAEKNLPPLARNLLIFLKTSTGTVPASVSLLAMTLLTLQCLKRFYETHLVSVFSDAQMDLSHYIVGMSHYAGAVLAILCEAPCSIYPDEKVIFSYSDIGLRHIISSLCFLWASISQLQSAKILGDLRRNKEGAIVSQEYRIPYGGYFQLVSCPHQFFEVVMYVCMCIILWGNETWPFVTLWVIVNQVETSFLSHWWYKETFKEYPKQRKAIVPFLL